jgi:DNA-directed RNA polymerase specialized sigma24 family protein
VIAQMHTSQIAAHHDAILNQTSASPQLSSAQINLRAMLQLHNHDPATDRANTIAIYALLDERKLSAAYDLAVQSKRAPVWLNHPTVSKHTVMIEWGVHTHIPTSNENVLHHCSAPTVPALESFLDSQRLFAKPSTVKLTARSETFHSQGEPKDSHEDYERLAEKPADTKREPGEGKEADGDAVNTLSLTRVRVKRSNVMQAFTDYKQGSPGSESALFQWVQRYNLATAKAYLDDVGDLHTSADEVAQEATVEVWQQIGTFKGNSGQFAAWVKLICINMARDGKRKTLKANDAKNHLEVEDEDGFMDDNPDMRWGRPSAPFRPLPAWIQGTDLWVCKLMREGLGYKQIASAIDSTEGAVKQRFASIRRTHLVKMKTDSAYCAGHKRW